MKYTVKQKAENQKEIKITLTAAEWEAENEKAYQANKGKYSLQGFRKGHVPRKVLENVYGAGVFFEEAFNEAFPKYYGEVLDKEKDLFPVDRPDIDIDKIDEKGIVFSAVVTTKPEVTVTEYKGMKHPKIEYNVTDADIEEEIKKAQERASRLVPVEDRPAEDGDTVLIDYSGSVDGVQFEGGTAEKQTLVLGSHSFIPGFEEGVVGMKTGEEKDLNVKFPEDYHAENLKGKDAVFHVKLHEIKKKEVPEFNDEFVKDVSEFDTVDAYRADIKKRLEEQNARRATQEMENALVDLILEKTPVNIPDCMIQSQIDNMVQEFEYRLMYQGLKLDDYLKYTGMKLEDLRKSYEDQAKKSVKTRLIFEAIIKQEKIEATEEDKQKKFAEMAEAAKKEVEEFKKSLPERQLEYIENEIIIDKLFALLNEWNPAS